MKKLLCVLLSVFMLCGCISIAASAAQDAAPGLKAVSHEEALGQGGISLGTSVSASYRASVRSASGNFDAAVADLVNGIMDYRSEVSIEQYDIPIDQVLELLTSLLYDHPQLFYLSNEILYDYYTDTNTIANVYLYYIAQQKDLPAMQKKFDNAVDEIYNQAKGFGSDQKKMLAVHEALVLKCEYDEAAIEPDTPYGFPFNAYGCLVDEKAVCQGYALAYKLVLNKLGIDCVPVVSDEMNHMWNMVRLGSKWYHVDATWDDPTPDTIGYVDHTYFLKSDKAMSAGDNPHTGWTAPYKAGDSTYDNRYWSGVHSAILPLEGTYYYVTSDNKLLGRNMQSGETKEMQFVPDEWDVWGESGYVWNDNFATVAAGNGKIYFNTSKEIYAVTPNNGEPQLVYTPGSLQGRIYGIKFIDGKLAYTVKKAPYDKDQIYFSTIELKNDPTKVQPFAKGDPTGDGNIKIDDVLLIQKSLVRLLDLDQTQTDAADVNGDGEISVRDAVMIQKLIAGQIASFTAAA